MLTAISTEARRTAAGSVGRRRRLPRRLRHWLRPFFSRPLVWLVARLLPRAYLVYMWFVFATSRVDDYGLRALHDVIDEHGGAVCLLWHEEALTAIYGYPRMGFRPATLASSGDAGQVVVRMLQLVNCVVFRGGSSRHKSRKKNALVLRRMIEYMRASPNALCALTVDGSKGPAYRIKQGGVIIARESNVPIVVQRTWHKRCLRFRTWDRMALPLPFNVITFDMRGPYFVPADTRTPESLERFVVELENDLIDLTAKSHERLGQPRPEGLVKRPQLAPAPLGHARAR